MEWLSGLGNIVSGGILGSITSLVGTWFKYKEAKDDREFKLKYLQAESAANIAEINANIEVNKTITEGQVMIEEAKADALENVGRTDLIAKLTGNYMGTSTLNLMIKDNTKIGLIFRPLLYLHIMFMDAVRGLVRPVLTVGIMGFIGYLLVMTLVPYIKTGDEAVLMKLVIAPAIQLILFGASTALGFWFSDKATSKAFVKNQSTK